jgi:SlyX protein
MTPPDNRLVDIETQLAYQEDLIQSLNEVVISMQQQIDKLELKNQRLQDNVKQMETLLPNDQNQTEQPPHY